MKTKKYSMMIADISGYTRFLSNTDLNHAMETITNLLNGLNEFISSKKLILNKIEGDALFFYSDKLSKLELLEIAKKATKYFNKLSLDEEDKHKSCKFSFCSHIHNLQIKFVINCGDVGIQQIGKYKELFGKSVIELHRLLKNSIKENDYILLVNDKGKFKENYDHLGIIKFDKIIV